MHRPDQRCNPERGELFGQQVRSSMGGSPIASKIAIQTLERLYAGSITGSGKVTELKAGTDCYKSPEPYRGLGKLRQASQ